MQMRLASSILLSKRMFSKMMKQLIKILLCFDLLGICFYFKELLCQPQSHEPV